MKDSTRKIRSSHVNTGTGIPRDQLPWPETRGRVLRLPRSLVEVDADSVVTPYGGLALAAKFLKDFEVGQKLDANVRVLKLHLPYHESDHVIAQALNLYVGGTCLEDQANLQHSEGVKRLLGACRIPDPTTAGDFLRRFDEMENPGSLSGLRRAVDEVQEEVWWRLAVRRGRRRLKRPFTAIDLDGHTKVLYGEQKQGADFSRKGEWSYHPLLVSMAQTGECLAVRNRPGNQRSCTGAAEVLDEVLPRVKRNYETVLVRGDSDFDVQELRDTCHHHGVYFAFVGREFPDRPGLAQSLPEDNWQPFLTQAKRRREQARRRPGYQSRRKMESFKQSVVEQREYKDLRTTKQWVAEVPFTPGGSSRAYRLVIRRQLIEEWRGQLKLFEEYRYRYVLTDLPEDWSTEEVVDETYDRCDQENLIEQMGSGLAMWRMPVAEFEGNCAWLEIARLAWNLGKWLAQLVLPEETVRWEWKRFRQAFVYLSAVVTRRARQLRVRFSGSHRFASTLVAAHAQLQT